MVAVVSLDVNVVGVANVSVSVKVEGGSDGMHW